MPSRDPPHLSDRQHLAPFCPKRVATGEGDATCGLRAVGCIGSAPRPQGRPLLTPPADQCPLPSKDLLQLGIQSKSEHPGTRTGGGQLTQVFLVLSAGCSTPSQGPLSGASGAAGLACLWLLRYEATWLQRSEETKVISGKHS